MGRRAGVGRKEGGGVGGEKLKVDRIQSVTKKSQKLGHDDDEIIK